MLERLERIVGYGKGLGRDSALDGAACYVAGLLAIVCLHLQSSESINPRCYALVSLSAVFAYMSAVSSDSGDSSKVLTQCDSRTADE